eukprot:TRINITY_DN3064_c0_g1_i8.p1 TRINITY_DN3064_c0_g1~~TRINITY_DN3064_c0_g1_i8.p1  ORF type:complete len:650 (+),score=129.94 TRINITY_DN3064_c0_g1_i8:610-2559(+)
MIEEWMRAKHLVEKPPPWNYLRNRSLKLLPDVTIYDLIELNDYEGVKEYIKINGAENINRMVCKSKARNSPLHVICLGCNIRDKRILELLLSVPGTNVNSKNISNNSPLHYFCSSWADPDLTILDKFFSLGADVNSLNDSKETPLLKAITNTRIRKVLMEKLLAHGSDPNILNSHHEGVLHYAARLARVDLVDLLLSYCNNMDVKGAEGLLPHELAYSYSRQGDPMLQASYLKIAVTLEKAHALQVWLKTNDLSGCMGLLITNRLWLHKIQRMKSGELEGFGLSSELSEKIRNLLSVLPVTVSKRSIELAKLNKQNDLSEMDINRVLQTIKDNASHVIIIPPEHIEFTDAIGKGASGAVWKGVYRPTPSSSFPIAIKVLFSNASTELVEFKKELSILSSVVHPNVVKLIGISLQPGLSMIMEYCGLASLFHVLRNQDVNYAWKLFFLHGIQITCGLMALHYHEPQILHRDMKSLNILVSDDWSVRVADFGLSWKVGTDNGVSNLKTKGTAAYLGPEVIEDNVYTEASDIYALGIVYWEMLYRTITGEYQRPYAEYLDIKGPAQRMILMYQTSKKGIRPTIPESTPQVLQDLLVSMLSHDPHDRPNTMVLKQKLEFANNLYKQNVSEWRARRLSSYWNFDGTPKNNEDAS